MGALRSRDFRVYVERKLTIRTGLHQEKRRRKAIWEFLSFVF